MQQIRKGTLFAGTHGCYRHAPVLSRQDLVRIQTSVFAFTIGGEAKHAAPKRLTQKQVLYQLRVKGYHQVDTLNRLQDSKTTQVVARLGDNNYAVVMPDGTLEWHKKRPVTHGEWYSLTGLRVKNERMKQGERRVPVTLPDYAERLRASLEALK